MTDQTSNLIGVASADFFDVQSGVVGERSRIAKMSADIIPSEMNPEDVKAVLKTKFEEDLAQAYLTAFNLIRLGVDPYPIMAGVFSNEATHPVFIL